MPKIALEEFNVEFNMNIFPISTFSRVIYELKTSSSSSEEFIISVIMPDMAMLRPT